MTHPRHPERIWISALLLSWLADQLFWGHDPGISFAIWVLLAIVGLFLAAFWEGKRPAWASYPLAFLTLALAVGNVLRVEPFSRFLSAFLSMSCLALLAVTLLNGHWLLYRTGDYLVAGVKLFAATIVRGVGLLSGARPPSEAVEPVKKQNAWQRIRQVFPYLRGLMLALPVLAILGGLLSAADPVFANQMHNLLSFLDVTRLPEYFFRLFYILIFTYVFCGVLLHAILPDPVEARPNPLEAWKTRFLGSTEAFIILGSVVAMFAFFLILQFRYLFGGQANISETGFTYSDYARRGFFELVWVAVLSLALSMGLGMITRRETPVRQRVLSALTMLLLGLVLLILASALQRLLLYENAYGFTRLRTYTHIFIPWLAVLLLAGVILEASGRSGHLGLAMFFVAAGFGITMLALNVDDLITRLNLARAQSGAELDIETLSGLSSDAVPALGEAYRNAATPQVRNRTGAALACHWIRLVSTPYRPDWRTYHPVEAAAAAYLSTLDLRAYLVDDGGAWHVQLNQETVYCNMRLD